MSTSPSCPECGSTDAYADSGPFALFGAIVGFARWTCRSCRRRFWGRAVPMLPGEPVEPDTGETPAEEALPSELPAGVPSVDGLDDLDAGLSPGPPAPPDLAALDTELDELGRKKGVESRRARRHDGPHAPPRRYP